MNGKWNSKPLEELCDFYNGLWTGKKQPFIKVNVIRNTNFTKDCNLDYSDVVSLDVEQRQFQNRKLKYGDIILEKSGGGPKQPVGRVVIFDKRSGDYSFSNFTSAIRIKDKKELDFNYLHRFLYLEYISGATEPMQSYSTGIRNLKFDEYKQIEIPLPPLTEQTRIVKILDEAFAALDKAKANTEKNLQNAKELFESYLQNVFEEKREEHKMVPLGELTKLSRGHNPPKSKFSSVQKPGYVRFYQIRDGWSDDYAVYVPKTSQLHLVSPEDILMVAYRHIGKAFRGVSGAFNVALCKITNTRKDILDDDYLFQLIPTSLIRGELLKRSERSLIPSMSVEHLREIKIPLPTLKKQRELIRNLNELNTQTKKLSAVYQQKLNDLEELKKSILQKAFSGELTAK